MFDKAYYMCPNRIVPLFEQYLVFQIINDCEKRRKMAQMIMNHPIKIPSTKVDMIMNYIRFFEVTQIDNN